ncbi:PhoX family protein [Paenibacillus sp. GCM10012303]|uniref:PhoX family protein n=1 Tax=Paenibacillus sp. GCM10012303 TaxID=3317340 RepID=UPI00361A4740
MTHNKHVSRRSFLAFIGTSAAALAAASTGLDPLLNKATASAAQPNMGLAEAIPFPALQPQTTDRLTAAAGYAIDTLAVPSGSVGAGSGHIGFWPTSERGRGLLWVSHKAGTPQVGDTGNAGGRGASVMGVQRSGDGAWKLDPKAPEARRLTSRDRIDLTGPVRGAQAVGGASVVQGLWCNGSGGRTPWGTVLAGEHPLDVDAARAGIPTAAVGWLAEADPTDSRFSTRKHTALGRFAHGDIAAALAPDGRAVLYMCGEQVLFKYISRDVYDPSKGTANSVLLENGTLYAADLGGGRWIELAVEQVRDTLADPAFRMPPGVNRRREELLAMLSEQADVLTHARETALVLGATQLEQAAGVALHPTDGTLFVSQTGSILSGSGYGSILRLVEDGGDSAAIAFESDLVLAGGRQAAFSSPGSISFDAAGRLWIATNMPADRLNQGAYAPFGNNALYALTASGETFAKAESFLCAPGSAILSLPAFGPDGTVFAGVHNPDIAASTIVAIRRM